MSAGTWDLVVVGAGPAGATAALAALRADPGLRVLLLDRADFPRDKCCGDGVAPHVLDVLRPLGAADVVDGWEPVRTLGLARGRARGRADRSPGRSGSCREPCSTPGSSRTRSLPARRCADTGCARSSPGPTGSGSTTSWAGSSSAPTVPTPSSAASLPEGEAPGRRALAIRGYAPTPLGSSRATR